MKIPIFKRIPGYYDTSIPNPRITLQGELSFEVWDKDSLHKITGNPLPGAKPRFETPYQPQIVTDLGFETYLNSNIHRSTLFGHMALGTGTTPASASDTTFAQIAGSGRFGSYDPSVTYATSGNEIVQVTEYRSSQGQVIGTATDCAIFNTATGGGPMMHSLIKDAEGIPTSLVLTSTDFIYIKWKTKNVTNLSDQTGTILLGEPGAEILYNWVMRPCSWNLFLTNGSTTECMFVPVASQTASSKAFGCNRAYAYSTQTLNTVIGGPPGGTSYSATNFTVANYVANSKQRKVSYKWSINEGNVPGGIGSVNFGGSGHPAGYQISYAAASGGGKIPKDITKELILEMMYSFGR